MSVFEAGWYTRDMSRVHPGQEPFDPSRKGDGGPVPRDELAEKLRGNDPDDALDHIGLPLRVPAPAADERIASSWQLEKRRGMARIHISVGEAARDFTSLLAHVRAGVEVVIENGSQPVAVMHTPAPPRRSIEECIALLPEDSPATIDEDFASDVEEAVAAHREPLNPPAWD
jgi:antitoxin (DNA-binding transcriptional repressor) of toxin-antitoxin stability system